MKKIEKMAFDSMLKVKGIHQPRHGVDFDNGFCDGYEDGFQAGFKAAREMAANVLRGTIVTPAKHMADVIEVMGEEE